MISLILILIKSDSINSTEILSKDNLIQGNEFLPHLNF
jgi:hypothetical protein